MTRPSIHTSSPILPLGAATAPQPGPLSSLEEALAGPEAKTHVATAQAQLNALEVRCRHAMRQGVAPSDFAQLDALVHACTAASEILRQIAPPPALESTVSIGTLFSSIPPHP